MRWHLQPLERSSAAAEDVHPAKGGAPRRPLQRCFEIDEATSTVGVLVCQVLFLVFPYVQAGVHGELRWEGLHISGVLDDPFRSVACGALSVLSGGALLHLEAVRANRARRGARLALAACCAGGILVTSLVRESDSYLIHALSACAAFGAGICLVWVVAANQSAARFPASLAIASALTLTAALVGAAQGLYLVELFPLPSAGLFVGECAIILGFALAISTVGAAPPPSAASSAVSSVSAPRRSDDSADDSDNSDDSASDDFDQYPIDLPLLDSAGRTLLAIAQRLK